jgi:hypothetical protein
VGMSDATTLVGQLARSFRLPHPTASRSALPMKGRDA